MKNIFYYYIPWWVIDLAIVALLLAAGEVGFRWGRRSESTIDERTRSQIAVVEGGLMGVLGLLLAFTMSMAVTRFEVRKQIVLDEANAIGTSHLRTKLLPAPESTEIADLLEKYVDLRLQSAASARTFEQRVAMRAETARLQNEFWSRAVAYAQKDPNPVRAGLLLQSLNQVIDLEGADWMAFQNRVPHSVLILNVLIGLLATQIVGYAFGLGGQRHGFSLYLFALATTLALAVIIDLDRPYQGFIQVSHQPMIDLQKQLSPGSARQP